MKIANYVILSLYQLSKKIGFVSLLQSISLPLNSITDIFLQMRLETDDQIKDLSIL